MGEEQDPMHGPPWKARWCEVYQCWDVTSDRGHPRDEYSALETLTEGRAKLMAAAPDLLAACEAIVFAQHSGDVKDVIWAMDAARVAIAKARGES